ncbi:L,D-transpeptidase family protein [Flavobacterium sp.]|uniref:L,D-transpeptidase family protein n=1 Tax=Flavobacterium sp. TaxID=239 RepID=UPI002B4AC40C|nr:L,D-transpeptidase family protein [Flavobacterium sp.]HLF52532.1 L,D-transpeptidase family protein [Flavobacterium sp.]
MRKLFLPIAVIMFAFLFTTISCKKKDPAVNQEELSGEIAFDSTLVKAFFVKYPKLKSYQSDVETLYRKHQYHYVWYDKKGINEFGNVLYNKVNNLEEEGIQVTVPYKNKLDEIYENVEDNQKPEIDTELLNSSLYFFYADKVYHGLDAKKVAATGWYLPRKKESYVNNLDSLLNNPSLINKDEKGVLSQYYRLKDVLEKYRQIEKNGGWKTIAVEPGVKSYKPGDSSKTIAQIRQWLFVTGDIRMDSKSGLYDKTMAAGILKFKQRNGMTVNKVITPEHIKTMNVPLAQRIKTIMVNMERCRWISNDITKSKELIIVNIPAYQLTYLKEGKPALISNVVVGKALNKTVIFSAPMKHIVFSPYWNVPTSILKKEILPGIEKNENYLEEHDMEWHESNVRQRPGPKNSLGLVKFLFPNSNAIYLHDTPSKDLFKSEDRAFSHGCVRVAKAKELANLILKNDKTWTPQKIDEAMHSGEEKWHTLANKIPVYIGYFTAWVDDQGDIHFYDDIYERDEELASLVFKK